MRDLEIAREQNRDCVKRKCKLQRKRLRDGKQTNLELERNNI